MITGYNTDVEHNGVVYHVQTEDKGTAVPLILSLVYVGGAILASKRSPYDDLMSAGLDQGVLADRLQRQHKLICAAIHAGRIEDLKRMGQGEGKRPGESEPEPAQESASPATVAQEAAEPPVIVEAPESQVPQPGPETFAVVEPSTPDHALRLTLLNERQLRGGEQLTIRVQVQRGSGAWERVVPSVQVVVKTLGSTFRPVTSATRTDRHGLATIHLSLPAFKTGRAAMLIRAEHDGEMAELRRIILPQ